MFIINETINGCSGYTMKPQNHLINQMRWSLAVNQRKIYIYDDVDESSMFEAIYYLNKIISLDRNEETKRPIDIYIVSNGGTCRDGFALISLIESMKKDGYYIRTNNLGGAYSMGMLIAVSGSERVCYKYADFMYHQVSSGMYGATRLLQRGLAEVERINERSINYIVEHTKIPREKLEQCNSKLFDWFISPEEALELGICDKII